MSGKVKFLAVSRASDRAVVASYQHVSPAGGDEYLANVQQVLNAPGFASQVGASSKLHLDNGPNTFHLMTDDGAGADNILVYIAITSSDYPRRHIFSSSDGRKNGILGELRDLFNSSHAATAATCKAFGLSRAASRQMKALAERYDDLRSLDKVASVAARVDEVTGVMQENIAIVLANTERVDQIDDKASGLAASADKFGKKATQLRKTMQCRYYKLNALIALIVLVVLAYIFIPIIQDLSGGDSE
mmetsp:Transcript_97337/g.236721  ORF Transcript_97337/g.236721 Transcript_97337/m.236721 type:complete len:246 (+) Transcript_97337:185-922(+)